MSGGNHLFWVSIHSFFVSSVPFDPSLPTFTISIIMDDPYEDRSMPADTTGRHIEQDDLLADLEDLKPSDVDYYSVLNLSKTVRKTAHYNHSLISFGKVHSD